MGHVQPTWLSAPELLTSDRKLGSLPDGRFNLDCRLAASHPTSFEGSATFGGSLANTTRAARAPIVIPGVVVSLVRVEFSNRNMATSPLGRSIGGLPIGRYPFVRRVPGMLLLLMCGTPLIGFGAATEPAPKSPGLRMQFFATTDCAWLSIP